VHLSAYLSRGVTTNAYQYRARITLHAPIHIAAQRISEHVGVLESSGDQRTVLHTGSNSLDELTRYVGLLKFHCTVHEPAELIEHIQHLANHLADAVGRPSGRNPSTVDPAKAMILDIASAVGAERLREIMADLAARGAAVVERYGGTACLS
jgi:hypothetical protein